MGQRGTLADRIEFFQPVFEAGGAPLYAYLTQRAAAEVTWPTSPFRLSLEQFIDERPERFLWLRVLALVHRWVLEGELPELAAYYRSAGGTLGPASVAWDLFREAVSRRGRELPELLCLPLQHNEVGRAAALACGFLLVSRETKLPLRLLEVGASAGLLLRWDHYLGRPWFDALFHGVPPHFETEVRVAERRGCDLHPVDATSAEGGLYLRSMVWADRVDHLAALEDALAGNASLPVVVDQADGANWLPRYGMPVPGTATVIYHSLMRASGPPQSLLDMDRAIHSCAAYAGRDAPLAYLRFEAGDRANGTVDPARLVEVWLTTWPDGEDRLLATCDVNGRGVRWLL